MGRKKEGKAEKAFKRFGKNIDSVIGDIKESERYTRFKINERISVLNKDVEHLEGHLSHASENVKSSWNDAKPNLERAGQELKKAMQTFFSGRRAY